jgi:hypothetical protein
MTEFQMVTRAGVDTLHRWPATEQCNLDDTENDVRIGLDAGWDAVIGGKAKACEHCFPLAGSAGDVR